MSKPVNAVELCLFFSAVLGKIPKLHFGGNFGDRPNFWGLVMAEIEVNDNVGGSVEAAKLV